ncbi:MAG: hypothetical protein CW338_04745 [Clostridiales bacterium]|nr:hypothetical protein [Clostridiales bacterium]
MYIDDSIISKEEKIIFTLRALYSAAGYTGYRMNKFEAYDLYMRNKDFLVSDGVITFTDTNGRLMALKPDVTLSIVKNSRYESGHTERLYYDEKVYRPARPGDPFREITQMGLENLGDIGNGDITGVLSLALQSLKALTESFVLDVSCMDLLSLVLDEMNAAGDTRIALLNAVKEKAVHEIRSICEKNGIEKCDLLLSLLKCEGRAKDVLEGEALKALCEKCEAALPVVENLKSILVPLENENINLDFSVQSDMRYYNGIVFSGFMEGIPSAVLRGGQYDRLVKRVGKKGGAIGFALYLDLLE